MHRSQLRSAEMPRSCARYPIVSVAQRQPLGHPREPPLRGGFVVVGARRPRYLRIRVEDPLQPCGCSVLGRPSASWCHHVSSPVGGSRINLPLRAALVERCDTRSLASRPKRGRSGTRVTGDPLRRMRQRKHRSQVSHTNARIVCRKVIVGPGFAPVPPKVTAKLPAPPPHTEALFANHPLHKSRGQHGKNACEER